MEEDISCFPYAHSRWITRLNVALTPRDTSTRIAPVQSIQPFYTIPIVNAEHRHQSIYTRCASSGLRSEPRITRCSRSTRPTSAITLLLGVSLANMCRRADIGIRNNNWHYPIGIVDRLPDKAGRMRRRARSWREVVCFSPHCNVVFGPPPDRDGIASLPEYVGRPGWRRCIYE